WCENDAASAAAPRVKPRGSDRSRESAAAASPRSAYDSPRAVRDALADATQPRRQTAGIEFRPAMHTFFHQLLEPFRPVAKCIDLLAGTGNPPTPIDRFYACHHSGEIPSDRQVRACQFSQSTKAVLAVVHRLDFVPVQQPRQSAGVLAIIAVPVFPQTGLAGIADYHSRHVRLQQIVQPGRPRSFFKSHLQT